MRNWSSRIRLVFVAVFAVSLLGVVATASAKKEKVTEAKAGTPQHAILEGIKIIVKGDFDGWVKKWCSPDKACYNKNSIGALKRYNFPAAQRLFPQCLKDFGGILITQIQGDPAKDDTVKVFYECNPKGMPRPTRLYKESGVWKWSSL